MVPRPDYGHRRGRAASTADLGELARDEAGVARAAHADGEVGLPPREVERALVDGDLEEEAGVARAQRGLSWRAGLALESVDLVGRGRRGRKWR